MALIFGGLSAAIALLVSFYDVDSDETLSLVLVSLVVVAAYFVRFLSLEFVARFSRAFPAWMVAITTSVVQVGTAVLSDEAEGHALLVVLALFYAFFREPNRIMAVVALVIAVPIPAILNVVDAIDSDGWLYWMLGMMVCAWFGHLSYNFRIVTQELEAQRNQATDRAVAHERRLIARDVHDLVGHSLSVMMLHLGVARRAVLENPETATSNLSQAESVGRQAMSEIRRTIRLLSDSDYHETHGADPVPGLIDLPTLVGQYQEAGLEVELEVKGDLSLIDGATSLAGYRIVQEALVNASKHAVGAAVAVEVRSEQFRGLNSDVGNSYASSNTASNNTAVAGPQAWLLTVTNGSGTEPAVSSAVLGQKATAAGGGLGLIGMAERARSVGGSLTAVPDKRGGWRVDARLPSENFTTRGE